MWKMNEKTEMEEVDFFARHREFFEKRAKDPAFLNEYKAALREQAQQRGYFYDKYSGNCAQSVLLAVQQLFHLEDKMVYKGVHFLAGGGIAGTCGALVGGLVALGLQYGRLEPELTRKHIGANLPANRLVEWFNAEFGTHLCEMITGVDKKDREAWMALVKSPEHEKCFKICGKVAAKVSEIISDDTLPI
jgi:C_GCAxxG_C_C family probable redox protein